MSNNLKNIYLSDNQKEILINTILEKDETCKNLLLQQIFKQQAKQIFNYLHKHNTDTCYVHIKFNGGQSYPIYIIDNNPNSNPDMFCFKYVYKKDI